MAGIGEQARLFWGGLKPWQKVSLPLAALAVAAGLAYSTRRDPGTGLGPLYMNLNQEDASAVVGRLRERNVHFTLDEDGRAVFVPRDQIPMLRLEMAGAGLPKNGTRPGWSIFDKVNVWETESDQQVKLQRAVEGELERSIGLLEPVQWARVHLSFPKRSPIEGLDQKGKASIVLHLKNDGKLAPKHVRALKHLAASAVGGLEPDGVSIIDGRGDLLDAEEKKTEDDLERRLYQRRIEFHERVEKMWREKVKNALDRSLGPSHYSADVTVQVSFTSSDMDERTLDPTKSVLTEAERTETEKQQTSTGGIPGTPTNLPRPPARVANNRNEGTTRSEKTRYDTAERKTMQRTPEGRIERVSVGVLVDHQVSWNGEGRNARRTVTPRPQAQLDQIRSAVEAISGFDRQRGDLVAVSNVPFETNFTSAPPGELPAPAQSPWPAWLPAPLRDIRTLLGLSALTILLVAGLMFFMLKKTKRKGMAQMTAALETQARKLAELHDSKLQKALEGARAAQLALENSQAMAMAAGAVNAAMQVSGLEALSAESAAGEGGVGVVEGEGPKRRRKHHPTRADGEAAGEDSGQDPEEPEDEEPEEEEEEEEEVASSTFNPKRLLKRKMKEQEKEKRKLEEEAIKALKLPPVKTKRGEVLGKYLAEEAKKDPESVAQILKTWIKDDL
ncbi:MAG: flagellar M-ring protein FliF [Acidobacteria bacterium]|nr:flagellar M-ring protein FliF [Acidobacteriota bacterium]